MYKYLYIVNNLNYYIIKNKNYIIYIKNKDFYFVLLIYFIKKINNYFYFFKKRKINYNLNLYFFSWKNFIVKKIKFKHKISWVYIFRKSLQIFKISTNLSHFIFLIINKINLKRYKKHLSMHTIVLWGLNFNYINLILKIIINSLPLNKYTQRGFRLARCKYQKRLGKVSKYTSLKSKVF